MDQNARIQKRIISYFSVGGGLLLGFGLLWTTDWQGSTQQHSMMEVASTLLALFVGIVALVRFHTRPNNTFLFIGVGFLGTAFLDGYHAIVTSSFFAASFPSLPESLIPWSWIASRFFLSIMLFLSWWAWQREKERGDAGRISKRMVYGLGGLLTLGSFLFFAFVSLPRAYYPELFFGRPEEFVPGLFLLLALVGYVRKGKWKTDPFEHWLVLSLIVGLLAQVVFMSFSFTLFDGMFDVAHLLKKVSYVLVLVGLLISMYHLFQQAESSAEVIGLANEALRSENKARKRAEDAFRKYAEELKRSNEELEQFASIASHDLQEPLRKIQAFGDRLQYKYGAALDERGRDYLTRMQGAASRMQVLIGDLLQLSRVTSAGRAFVETDLAEVVREVLGDLEIQIERTGAQVETSDLPTVKADPMQMHQLLQNLISNALKFRREDRPPSVRVYGRVLHDGVAHDVKPPVYQIHVEDNGIGFDEKYLDRIFKPFQRLHGRNVYEGTGIGLAICHKIVDRHNGALTATSTPGEGTTFTITLSKHAQRGKA